MGAKTVKEKTKRDCLKGLPLLRDVTIVNNMTIATVECKFDDVECHNVTNCHCAVCIWQCGTGVIRVNTEPLA